MIEIARIREEQAQLEAGLAKRGVEVDFAQLLDLDDQRRSELGKIESKRAERNKLSKDIGMRRSKGEDVSELQTRASTLREEIAGAEEQLKRIGDDLQSQLEVIPNVPDERVPGGGKEHNVTLRTGGARPELPAEPLDHVELCARLGLVDYERGTKIAGHGSWLYVGIGAVLEWALLNFFVQEHLADGYTFMLPPHLLLEECGYGAGQFPKFRDEVYDVQVADGEQGKFLLPTSETAILNVYRDEVLALEQLPIKAFAYTPCYRREAGSHRTEERGTIRGHQFNKVEMFQFVTPETAEHAFHELVAKSESLINKLGLHYQTTFLAAKDTSASMAMTNDVEVWIPSMGIYKEASSVSWAGDYQARRAQIKFRREKKQRAEYVHTLNGSGLATSRVLPAIVEQFQQADGSVVVPEPLRQWVGCESIRPPGS